MRRSIQVLVWNLVLGKLLERLGLRAGYSSMNRVGKCYKGRQSGKVWILSIELNQGFCHNLL